MEQEKRAPYDYNVAKLPKQETTGTPGGYRANEKRERVGGLQVHYFDKKIREKGDAPYRNTGLGRALVAKFYMRRSSSGSTVYCDVWIFTRKGLTFNGSGSAGGHGYHKISAAFDSALRDAGVELEISCSGCGDGAMRHAAEAVTRAAGYSRLPFHTIQEG